MAVPHSQVNEYDKAIQTVIGHGLKLQTARWVGKNTYQLTRDGHQVEVDMRSILSAQSLKDVATSAQDYEGGGIRRLAQLYHKEVLHAESVYHKELRWYMRENAPLSKSCKIFSVLFA